MGYVVLLGVALVGWGGFKKLNFPVPALLGPMIIIAAVKAFGMPLHSLPEYSSQFFQLILGLSVGAKIDRDKIKFLKGVFWPTMVTVIWTIGFSVVTTVLLVMLTNLTVPTALFGGAPGGIAVMSVLALAYEEADVAIIAMLQFLRLLLVAVSYPLLVRSFAGEGQQETAATDQCESELGEKLTVTAYFGIIFSGLVPGVLLIYFNVPAGGLIGAILGLGAANVIVNGRMKFSLIATLITQMGIGTTVGLRFTNQTIGQIVDLFLPVILFSTSIVLSGIALAFILRKMTKWDFATCLLCAAPAGFSQMISMAGDIGADVLKVSFFQVVRLLTVLLVLQQLFQWYLH